MLPDRVSNPGPLTDESGALPIALRGPAQNLGRAIVKKTTIKISGNEVMSIDDSDIFHSYVDLWKSPSERMNMAYQGIGKANMLKHSRRRQHLYRRRSPGDCWRLQEQVLNPAGL